MNGTRAKVAAAQFGLRHLAILISMFAVFLALVTPLLRRLPPQQYIPALLQFFLLFGTVVAAMVFTGYKRQRVLAYGGAVHERFESPQTRMARVLLLGLAVVMWIFVVALFVVPLLFPSSFPAPDRRPSMMWAYYTFVTTNFLLSQIWWKIDPRGIEVCEGGLILRAFQWIPWDAIQRVSWSTGTSGGKRTKRTPVQLNLFLRRREVMHFAVAAEHEDRLRAILETHYPEAGP